MLINVKYGDDVYEVEEMTKVEDFVRNVLKIVDDTALACKINNEVKSLRHSLVTDCKLELIDYTTTDGNRIYVRGLTFILIKAFRELYPDIRLNVNYSLGHSLYCEPLDGKRLNSRIISNVEKRMKEIVKRNIPFEKKELTVEEAKKLYEADGRDDKIGLIETRLKSYVSMYYCGDTADYFYGTMPLSTKYMQYFDIKLYGKGLILVYPRRHNPTNIEKIIETKKLYTTFDEYDKLHKILGVENVSSLNACIKANETGDLIRTAEALHEKKIANIADMIASDRRKRIVLIAGPSSSGKTTFAQRLSIQLRVNGIKAVMLSMDNYFVNRADNPLDENGDYDFECIEAIDIKLFNEQLSTLLDGGEVKLPTFDFTNGERKYLGNTAKLEEDEVLVIEGIHGLNEKLTAAIPRSKKFKIYISALTTLNIDDYNRIATTDTRLIRRIYRDSVHRSHKAVATMDMWDSVRKGEEKYIFPFQEDADVMFNSSLVYELSVLKPFVEPLLLEVGNDLPEYSEARRLYEFLGYFLPLDTKDIPVNSILREFVGGGCFHQ